MAQALFRLTIINNFIDKASAPIRNVTKSVENLERVSRRAAMRFFGVGMGFLFMGMALKRSVEGFIKSMLNSYKMAGAEQTVFNQKTNELAAASVLQVVPVRL